MILLLKAQDRYITCGGETMVNWDFASSTILSLELDTQILDLSVFQTWLLSQVQNNNKIDGFCIKFAIIYY